VAANKFELDLIWHSGYIAKEINAAHSPAVPLKESTENSVETLETGNGLLMSLRKI